MPRPSVLPAAPVVTVAIACRDEASRIEALVRTALEQDWPRGQLQLVVADGMSMDATREILARLAAEDDRIDLVDNPGGHRATGLNECLKRARGEVVVRLDPGGDYPLDYVRRCVDALVRTGADAVEGTARAKGGSFLQRCVGAALHSPISVRARVDGPGADGDGWVDGVHPTAYRREVFERVGLYDPGAPSDEDGELRRRIQASGGLAERAAELDAEFIPRASLRSLARRAFGFGRGRARTLLKHGRFSSWGPSLPAVWLAAEVALAIAAPRKALAWSLAAYALATGAEAVRLGRREGPAAVPVVWALFPVLHLAHGAGFVSGLARYVTRPDWDKWDVPDRLDPRGASVAPQAARAATA